MTMAHSADLIRLAQNPAQSGLVPPPVAAAHDAISALQLSALGDLAGHAVDAHHVDDIHAAALALPAAVHEDVSHVTAAVVDRSRPPLRARRLDISASSPRCLPSVRPDQHCGGSRNHADGRKLPTHQHIRR